MLRSVRELTGYVIRAIDGDIGQTADFYFDDERWAVRYLVVDTATGQPGSFVLVSPMAITNADFDNKRIELSRTMDQVRRTASL